jgi:hypothetical protein
MNTVNRTRLALQGTLSDPRCQPIVALARLGLAGILLKVLANRLEDPDPGRIPIPKRSLKGKNT